MSAPIGLFCFRRPEHLQRTLTALAANHGAAQHDVIAFADGPRHDGDRAGVTATRRVLDEWQARGAFRSFTVDAQPANLGLRASITRGVGRLCAEAGEAIVVEDDLETSPWFLTFCRDGLERYRYCDEVASIHGYIYPVAEPLPETFFLRGADCWGWATWKRAWDRYEDDAGALLTRLREGRLARAFDHGGARRLMRMLADARSGRVDSWAVRWHASAFIAGMFTLYPGHSLVRNIGLDASGTHCRDDAGFAGTVSAAQIMVREQPIAENVRAWDAVRRHFLARRSSMVAKVLRAWVRFIVRPRSSAKPVCI